MSGLKSIFEKMSSRKVKVFLVFLLCSFFAWTVSKLSEEYESEAKFEVAYTAIPDSLLLKNNGSRPIFAKIKASGFQFLSYAINAKTIRLNLQEILEQDGVFFLTEKMVRNQMERQLSKSVSLLNLKEPIYYTELYLVDVKMVPVEPQINLGLAQNYLLKGGLVITPDSIRLKGPGDLLAQIIKMNTVSLTLDKVSSDFSQTVAIQNLDSLGDIVAEPLQVKVSGEVVLFSEKEFDVKLRAQNVPEGFRLKMFPDHIKLLCKAGVGRLKELQADDFEVVVDYTTIQDENYLYAYLKEEPKDVFSVRLLQNQIEFVLEKL